MYFSANTKNKSAISHILKKWGVKLGTYSGPNVKHGKMAFKSEKLGAVILKILKEAKKKGGIDAVHGEILRNSLSFHSSAVFLHIAAAGLVLLCPAQVLEEHDPHTQHQR